MQNSSLIQILKTFSPKELKEFELFTASPFFNKNVRVTRLLSILKNEYPIFKTGKIQKVDLFKKLFPGEEYSEENMKTIIYLLTRLAEKYMAYEKFQSDPYDEKNYLLDSLDKRKLDNIFIKHEKQISEKINNTGGVELTSLYKRIDFEKIRGVFYSERNIEHTMYQTDIKTGNLIITSFFIEMFRLTNLFGRIKYLGFNLDHDFATELMEKVDMKSFLESMKEYSFENLPVIEVYYYLHNTLNDTDSDEHYWNFKRSFEKNRDKIGKSEQYVISTLMVNCLYYKHLKDSAKYDRELFEAFKILLSLYDYSGDKYLRFAIYTNILRLTVQFKKFDWTEDFIKEYSVRLKPEQKENMMYYSSAFLSFAKGEFAKTLEYASKINFDTFQMKYYMRDLQLSAFYELSQFDAALDMIDAYKHFIKKEKNYSASLKQGYLEFINCLYSLIKIRLGEGKINVESLKTKIQSANSMRKQWLLDKIEELERK